ncbi:MAG: CapA family protein [Candidatus Pacebacteria bacterium]|nr:CapA family protein [Candidatus Paceibacterota bacterium]
MTSNKKALSILGAGTLVLVATYVFPHTAQDLQFSSAPISTESTSVSVLFVGDIMLDRAVAQHARQYGDRILFAGVQQLFRSTDLLVGNLEGSITTNESVSEQNPKILKFTFDPHFADLLYSLGFDAVSLANNHALDFGAEGYASTQEFLRAAGIAPFGHPLNNRDLSTPLRINGQTVCLIGYHSLFDPESAWVAAEIKKLRPVCTQVVVMAHWGEEYQHEPTAHQIRMAHLFIDLGADVVIGAHPHIVQPIEIYNNRAIFYSLGNFLFDQGFQSEVKRGTAVAVEFAASTTTFTLTPVTTFKEVNVADATTTAAVLRDLGVDGLSFTLTQ